MSIDAVTLEVARNRFAAVADEMGVVLRRTAYSPNIKERADCSAAVFVPSGEMLAQAEHIPVHLGSMPASVAAILKRFGTGVEPGFQYAVNDPYFGGTHLNDLTLVRPVFLGDRLVGWAANRAHHADVGGEAPGSMPAHATVVDQEGHIVAPTPAVRDGEWLSNFVDPFLAATRTAGGAARRPFRPTRRQRGRSTSARGTSPKLGSRPLSGDCRCPSRLRRAPYACGHCCTS